MSNVSRSTPQSQHASGYVSQCFVTRYAMSSTPLLLHVTKARFPSLRTQCNAIKIACVKTYTMYAMQNYDVLFSS